MDVELSTCRGGDGSLFAACGPSDTAPQRNHIRRRTADRPRPRRPILLRQRRPSRFREVTSAQTDQHRGLAPQLTVLAP